MSSYISVVLDTAAPGLTAQINGGAPSTPDSLVALVVNADDSLGGPVEVLIWGDIDATDPLNDGIGETEDAATWHEVESPYQVRLLPGGGIKRLFVRARDEVLNVSEIVTATISLEETVTPTPRTPRPPAPLGGPKATEVVRFPPSVLHMEWQFRTEVRDRLIAPSTLSLDTTASVHAQAKIGRSRVGIEEFAMAVRASAPSFASTASLDEMATIHKRPEGPQEEEDLLAIDIL